MASLTTTTLQTPSFQSIQFYLSKAFAMSGPSLNTPIDPSSLIFPSASTSISSTLTSLKRTNLSISNRLRSIVSDAAFVERIADQLDLPLVANERCGSWYIHPSRKAGSAYFKSTDGHHGQWSFSLRRLNLQVLDVIEREGKGGCIIVDSTRKGKSMPDALSKTAPIWIAVINRLLFPKDARAGLLRTPGDVVAASEEEQIEERIAGFVHDARSLALDLDGLRAKLGGKPMLPMWVTPESKVPLQVPREAQYNFIGLCTASSRSSSSGSLGSAYVQGAADDSESWALGLDAATFWTHQDRLLQMSGDELPEAINVLVAGKSNYQDVRAPVLVHPTSNLWIGSNATAKAQCLDFDSVICCSERPFEEVAAKLKDRYVHLSCSTGKVGSRQLRSQLPAKLSRLESLLEPTSKILITCDSGRDLAVGVALAVICSHFDEEGAFVAAKPQAVSSKTVIKQRLGSIMVCMPNGSPSRATLQSVNAFLLGGLVS